MAKLVCVGFLVIGLSLIGSAARPAVDAAADCTAELESELIREEPGETGTHFTWKVDISTEEDCATVEFRLILTLQRPDGKEQTVVRLGQVRLSDGSISHQMRYETKADDRLTKWEVVQSKCEPCLSDDRN